LRIDWEIGSEVGSGIDSSIGGCEWDGRSDMGQLLFKKCFWEAIRGGTKRTTIRRWSSARLKAGQRAFSPGVGWLTIDAIEVIDDLDRLGDADARADGFETIEQMHRTLVSFYPSHGSDGRRWFRVAFRCELEVVKDGARSLAQPKLKSKLKSKLKLTLKSTLKLKSKPTPATGTSGGSRVTTSVRPGRGTRP